MIVIHGHDLTMVGMPSNGCFDIPGVLRWAATGQTEVAFLGFPLLELPRQFKVGLIVFGNDEATAGFFVEPMNNAWPGDPADAA